MACHRQGRWGGAGGRILEGEASQGTRAPGPEGLGEGMTAKAVQGPLARR